jgi:lipopolysaccharide export system protein LptC
MKYAFTADRFRTWFFVLLLAGLVLGSFWKLEIMRRDDSEGNSRASSRSEPDYYVEKFSYIRLPNNGKANYLVTGDKLTHNPVNDAIDIIEPRINSFNAEKTPLIIRADRAVIEQKNLLLSPPREHDQIHLRGNVQAERPDSATSQYMKLQSEYLLMLPDENQMKTDLAVNFLTANSEIHATGMTADNATQQIQLLSKVRATFSAPGNITKPKS